MIDPSKLSRNTTKKSQKFGRFMPGRISGRPGRPGMVDAYGFLVVGGFIVPPKENAVCTAATLDFFVMSSTPEVVKTHLSSGHGATRND